MNPPSVFLHSQFGSIRVIDRDGNPWFVAKDVAEALGYTWNGESRIAHIPAEWRGVTSVVTPSGVQEMLYLTEQGLYFFLGRSDKEAALPFQKWLAGEVLPAIRKHGGYLTPSTIEAALTDPDTIIRLATTLKEERQKRIALEGQAAIDRPKVIFADAVDASRSSILIGDLAKLLRQNGVIIGQNRLFGWLRENGFLMRHGERKNMPTQYAMEHGLFEIKERTICNPDGSSRITRTTKATGKGQIALINRFLQGNVPMIQSSA
jgi:anti-repressor protein